MIGKVKIAASKLSARRCHNNGCRAMFYPTRRLLNFRFCAACTAQRKKSRRQRKSPVREATYPKSKWASNRISARMERCGICGLQYTRFKPKPWLPPIILEHCHHLIPARLAALHGDPHHRINILSVDAECHGRLKTVDNLILKGDWVGAVAEANRCGVPMARFKDAAEFYGFDIHRIQP